MEDFCNGTFPSIMDLAQRSVQNSDGFAEEVRRVSNTFVGGEGRSVGA